MEVEQGFPENSSQSPPSPPTHHLVEVANFSLHMYQPLKHIVSFGASVPIAVLNSSTFEKMYFNEPVPGDEDRIRWSHLWQPCS